tara:strand:+ start:6521 stop:7102 length:582 start_codon:yes stop_codon:yes gene_type:complete
MSDLTITNAGVSVTPKRAGNSVSKNKYNIITVTPTVSTDAYAVDDVLFTGCEIPNAVLGEGGVSKLVHMYVLDTDDQAASEQDDVLYFFTEKSTAFGTINASADISAANIKAAGICGYLLQDGDQAFSSNDLDNATITKVFSASGPNEPNNNITYLKAAPGSTSVYCHAILRSSTTPDYANADALRLIFHIEY